MNKLGAPEAGVGSDACVSAPPEVKIITKESLTFCSAISWRVVQRCNRLVRFMLEAACAYRLHLPRKLNNGRQEPQRPKGGTVRRLKSI